MIELRIIPAAAAALALASACSRPPAPVADRGATVPVEALAVDPADVRIDVSGMAADADAPAEDVAAYLALYADFLSLSEPGGRPAAAVISILDLEVANPDAAAFFGRLSSLSGTVALVDLSSGEAIVGPEPLDVDVGPHLVGELIGVNVRDRADVKAQKMSKEFMRRARAALYGPTR